MKKLIDRLKRMFIVGLRQIQDPYYHGFAAQISFYMMLSIVPLLLLLIQLLGLVNVSAETLIDVIEQYTGRHTSEMIISLFEFNSIGLGNIVFLFIAFWAGSRASFAIARITNYTMTEGETTGKSYFVERARAIITMLLTLLSLVLAMIILCYGKVMLLAAASLLHIEDTSFVDSFWVWMRWPLGFVLYFLIIGYNYYILPTNKVPFRKIAPGAIFGALGIMVVSWAYSFYTTTLANYDIMYGALSTVVALMIWFLFLAWVIILGVMVNKVFSDTSKPFSKMDPPVVKGRHKVGVNMSRFDMNPDDVDIHTIKDIIIGGGKITQNGEKRKPINKR